MSTSWRISTTFDDRSQKSLSSSATGTGATVVAGSRSLEEPVLFAKGETQRMLNLLGVPMRQDQGLLEAIEYNKSYPLYCVSPAKNKKFNYITFTQSDNYVFASASEDYATSLEIDSSAGTWACGIDFEDDGSGNLTCNVPISVNPEEILIYSTAATGALDVTVSSSAITGDVTGTVSEEDEYYTLTIPSSGLSSTYTGSTMSARYNRSMGSDVMLLLIQRGSGNFIQGNFTKKVLKKGESEEDNTYYLVMSYTVENYLGNYQTGKGSPVNFALEAGAVDGFQKTLNAETKFSSNDYFVAYYNPSASATTNMFQYAMGADGTPDSSATYASFNLNAVTRVSEDDPLSDTDLSEGYAFYHKTKTYDPDLFFDATGSSTALSELEDIRENYHPYARVLVPLYTDDPEDVEGAIANISSIPASRGFSAYWGEFEITNQYSTEYATFQGVPMGSIAVRHADAITLSYGGLAVAWIDENGVGGQLSGTRLVRGLCDPSEDELEELDENRINAVVYDDTYGPMILSRRTTYTDYSDYSFNDYSGIIDYCVKNIIKNALPYQIVKMNDATHRATVRNRIDSILKPLTVAPYNVLRAYAIKCDSENNTDEVMNNEQFVVDCAIQVQSKSETIKLTFINTAQTTTVEEALA